MAFNLDKCVVMHFGNKNMQSDYEMGGCKLKQSVAERDLGVIISNDGKASEQCLLAAKKANCMLGMIKRNIKSRSKDIIVRLYKTLIRPKLEYCVQIWRPHLSKDMDVLEKVQKRATKLITSCKNWGYEDRLRYTGLMSLKIRRKRGDMIEVFKLIKSLDKIDSSIFFTMGDNSRVRGHQYKLQKSHTKLDMRKHYVSNRIINAWNSQDENVVAAETVNCFKARLDRFIENNNSWEDG
jgi:hypothetical protein